MRDITLGDTFYHQFTTRAFASGVPTQLAGTPVLSVLEENNATPITAGVSVSVDRASVTGLNEATIVATSGNGYESGKSYAIYISTGTVGGVSVVGEVVGHFTIEQAPVNWGSVTGATTAVDLSGTDIQLVDTVTTYTGNTPQTGDSYAVVNSGTFGNAQLVRSTTPANTLDVSATGEAGVDWANVGGQGTSVDLSATAINLVDTATTATNLTNAPTNGDLTATMKTSVNTEVADVLKTDTISEMAQQAPPATPTFEEAVMYLYMALRNEITVTSSSKTFSNDAGTVIHKKALSDNGTTYTEAESATGP